MTISEAIAQFERISPEHLESELLLTWLDRLEGIIYDEIISTHEDGGKRPVSCFEGERELSACEPYTDIYPLYMAMQSDMIARDTSAYANDAAAFVSAYSAFADHYNRAHKPLGVGRITV